VGHRAIGLHVARGLKPQHRQTLRLQELSDRHRHLLNLGVVEGLDVLHELHILAGDEVDGDTLAAKAAGAANAVNVVLAVVGQVVVDG